MNYQTVKNSVSDFKSAQPANNDQKILENFAAQERAIRNLPLSAKKAIALLRQAAYGSLVLELPNGLMLGFSGARAGTQAAIRIQDYALFKKLFLYGDIALGEAFRDGEFTTPSLPDLLQWACENSAVLFPNMSGGFWQKLARLVSHRRRENSATGSKRNIAAHYDLGNDFYAAWLDASMTYSAAIFTSPHQSLEEAQRNKYQKIAELLGLQPGQHILEIGCGWGGFAEFAIREYGAFVTGITLSQQQKTFAEERLARSGLGGNAHILLKDYRAVQGQYDHVASIEMLEAVGEKFWPGYVQKLRGLLKPGGKAALQFISIPDERFISYRRNPDFIQRYIFPGGMLVPPQRMNHLLQQSGFTVQSDIGYGLDYARTLRIWDEKFIAAQPRVKLMGFDAEFCRLWRYYLCYCEAGFRSGLIDLRQICVTA